MQIRDTLLALVGAGPSPRADAAASVQLGGGDVAQVSQLPTSVAEAFGISLAGVKITRREAMRVPAMRRARAIVAGTISTLPLIALRQDRGVDGRPAPVGAPVERIRRTFLEQPDPTITRQTLIAWTVDDLMFYPAAWWQVLDRDANGYPRSVHRLDPRRVNIDAGGRVYVDGRHMTDEELIRFDSPDEGLLETSGGTLRTALELEVTVRVLSQPVAPLVVLRDTRTTGAPALTEDVDAILEKWASSRRSRGVAWLPNNVALDVPSWDPSKLGLTEAREQIAVDIARATNLASAYTNAPSESGMTYANRADQRRELVDLSLAQYLEAIAGRLSLGDVTPPAQRVTWDLEHFLAGSRAERIATAVAASGGPVLTTDEARAQLLDLPPMPAAPAPSAPREDPAP